MGNKPPDRYYELLHVGRDASPQGVRAAFRSLARQWHPDKHPPASRPQAEARFKAITEAYEVWPLIIDRESWSLQFVLYHVAGTDVIDVRVSQALLDHQENRAARARESGITRSAEKDRVGGGAAVTRGAPNDKTTRAPAPCTPPREAAKKNVYSACSNVGGRRAFAEFSSYVVRKAPPLERELECTLEELCAGCKKEVRFTRDVVTKNG
jgi:DnaJ homolog subfamily B member 13